MSQQQAQQGRQQSTARGGSTGTAQSRARQARTAVRKAAKARLALSGSSGSGKSWVALSVAQVLAPGGRILVIDSEAGDGEQSAAELYADVFEFDVLEWQPPFDPRDLAATLRDLYRPDPDTGDLYDAVIVDTASPFWRGQGGTLDISDGRFGGWKVATPAQDDLVDAILRAPWHCIVCTRAKTEYLVEEGENRKQKVTKVGMAPIQRDDLEYEFQVAATIDRDHRIEFSKALADDEPVLTPDGWVPIAALVAGDVVCTPDGSVGSVTGVYPQGVRPLFAVALDDGTVIRADGDHLWVSQTQNERRRALSPWTVKTTADLAGCYLPIVSPVHGAASDLPIDPYALGALLGDGSLCTTTPQICTDEWIVDRIAASGLVVKRLPANDRWPQWMLPGLQPALRSLGLFGTRSTTKAIPDLYRFGPARDRLALMQGLLDTDGTPVSPGLAVFSSSSPALAGQAADLARSLGWGVRVTNDPAPRYTYRGQVREGAPAWQVTMRIPAGVAPFLLPRKAEKFRPRSTGYRSVPIYRRVTSVTPDGEGSATCIAVDHPESLFITRGYTPTHNTRAHTLAGKTFPANQQGQFAAAYKQWLDSGANLLRMADVAALRQAVRGRPGLSADEVRRVGAAFQSAFGRAEQIEADKLAACWAYLGAELGQAEHAHRPGEEGDACTVCGAPRRAGWHTGPASPDTPPAAPQAPPNGSTATVTAPDASTASERPDDGLPANPEFDVDPEPEPVAAEPPYDPTSPPDDVMAALLAELEAMSKQTLAGECERLQLSTAGTADHLRQRLAHWRLQAGWLPPPCLGDTEAEPAGEEASG